MSIEGLGKACADYVIKLGAGRSRNWRIPKTQINGTTKNSRFPGYMRPGGEVVANRFHFNKKNVDFCL